MLIVKILDTNGYCMLFTGNNSPEMELADKTVGFLLSLTSLSIFTYYTFWVIILVSSSPMFIDDDLPNVISFSELDHIHEYIS